MWVGIDREKYQVLKIKSEAKEFRETSVSFLSALKDKEVQIRDDYQEIVELILVLLGNPPEEIHWRAPGPIHHARWMTKLIYAVKIYLFREQRDIFKLTKEEESAVERFVHFWCALIYDAMDESNICC